MGSCSIPNSVYRRTLIVPNARSVGETAGKQCYRYTAIGGDRRFSVMSKRLNNTARTA